MVLDATPFPKAQKVQDAIEKRVKMINLPFFCFTKKKKIKKKRKRGSTLCAKAQLKDEHKSLLMYRKTPQES
jgi:uncharacterized protein YdgA (DUF945 family)